MGGYASTAKKAKTTEEGDDRDLHYAASGMQGWRASMEDAHIALVRVPQGHPPSSAAIGAARIGMFSQNKQPPLGSSSSTNVSNGGSNGAGRGRAGTYSAGDAHERTSSGRAWDETESASNLAVDSEGQNGEGVPGGPEGADESSSAGAGWKAVDLLEDAAFFGVFDGHGGKAVADFCKERLPGLLAASPDIRGGNWKDGFPRVYHALDALLVSGEGQEKAGGWGGMNKVDGIGVGCTIVTALLDRKRGQCYVAHAGDSRCVLCRAGRAVQLTRDHKPGIPSEYARILGAGGHVSRVGRVNDNLNLSRAIGDMVYKRNHLRLAKDQIISAEPDVCRFQVTPGVDEFLILACDGVWEMMDTTQGLRGGIAPRDVCESLLDACLSPDPRSTRYAGCDNMTVVLVLLEGWESALVTKAYTPASTFSGGRLGSVGEAAAALSATLPRMPRKSSSRRLPLPAEFRMAKKAPTLEKSKSSKALPAQGGKAGEKANTFTDRPTGAAEGDSALAAKGKGGSRMGWPQRRIAAGKVAPPRTAHGIEFSLASFSAPVSFRPKPDMRASTGSMDPRDLSGVVVEARAIGASDDTSVQPNVRRRRNHLRSATAPMLPSPLVNNRSRRAPPSEERLKAAAAMAVLNEVGAAGAVAAAAAAENEATPLGQLRPGDGNVSPTLRQAVPVIEVMEAQEGQDGKTLEHQELENQVEPPVDAGLVFVPVTEDVTPVEVTVTAEMSPS